MAASFIAPKHVFSIDDLTLTYTGVTYTDNPSLLDTDEAVVESKTDKDGNVMYGIDSEFGFYVTDFIGAEDKELDGDYGEGFAGNIFGDDGNAVGIAVYDAKTDLFRSGAPLGTWALGLGGTTVKASTEHYVTMSEVLSDQAYPGDPNAIAPLDDDLKMLDLRPTGPEGELEAGVMHEKYVRELTQAMQTAIDNTTNDQTYSDIDFDRDGTLDTYATVGTEVQADLNEDGIAETIVVGGVDLNADGEADIVDSFLNGFGGKADVTDLLEPNESSVTYDIAYGDDYSVTLKDDGKLLYRWGEAIKRPNDIRMEVNMDLPEEWTRDLDKNGTPDCLEDGSGGFTVTRAELVITHDITNNPNDQVRPEDYENEAAIGRLPSYYIVTDPDDAENTLWVSPVDTYNGEGHFLPSYFKLDESGNIDLSAGGIAVNNPDGTLVGYRNVDEDGNTVGTVLRDLSLAALSGAAGLDFITEDLAEGYTTEWYTTTDREPFEWSYDLFPDDPYANVFESFRNPDDAAAAGFDEADLVSGPRWRLTPNKFGQDLPGLEVPLEENSQPPFQRDNIKYDTGELTTTTLNLLDWDGPSPLANSAGWLTVDKGAMDENGDGLIDEGWTAVKGTLGAGDAMPTDLIFSAVTPNGVHLQAQYFDTAVYIKGDRQDSAQLYDMELIIEYGEGTKLGSVQMVEDLNHLAKTVEFEGGMTFDNAVVFATPTTRNGTDSITVEFSEVTSTGATMYVEEPDSYDNRHVPEDVALVAFEQGEWTLNDGSLLQVGETVFSGGETNDFRYVAFEEAFEEAPVVMVQVQTNNGAQWEVVRMKNITRTGFEYAIQEEEAATDGRHTSEVIGWAALDAADENGAVDWSTVMGQAFTASNITNGSADEFQFSSDVGTNPLIAASISTYHGGDTTNLRLLDLTDDGTSATASFLLQEERSLDAEVTHVPEDVAGMAFAHSGILMGTALVEDTMAFV